MEVQDYFKYLVQDIHSVVAATVDDGGQPVTCVIDLMDGDEDGIYFLTAKGKDFYRRLTRRHFLSLTGMKGEDTLSCRSLTLRGAVKELGQEPLAGLLEKNPYMAAIYPDEASRKNLTVFQLWHGTGEWFDLSKRPIERESFSFGGSDARKEGYFITDRCVLCRLCYSKCPQKCIDISRRPAVIQQEHCLHCGNCYEVCLARAIVRRSEL